MTEQREHDLVTLSVRRRFRVRTRHPCLPVAILEHELCIPIDDAHVALGASEHVAERAARPKEKAPQSSHFERQRLRHLDTDRLPGGASEDRTCQGQMFVGWDEFCLTSVAE